ncbi:MAG: metallophosphoesterase [Hymenobacteraceae bacterium]|nr:metallophosphoesterase [Hymenobacteraceae bacterium]MDX5395449.1 metallophosphoesterase [Hymenobacteraceae bacterium]MDX5511498.1 metallophosphoesterase [Hymenobacteraceae bacterium]
MRKFIWIMGLLSLLMDWYVYQGIKRLTQNWKSNRRNITHWSYWIFFTGFNISFIFSVYHRFTHDQTTPFTQWVLNMFLAFFVTKLVFILVLFGEDLVRGITAFFRLFQKISQKTEAEQPLVPGRRKFISQAALILASIPFASFVYGIAKGKYAYTVHRHTLYFEGLPAAFDGFKITQLSDIHAGSFDDAAAVQEGIDLVKAQNPDLFVFTGDLVNDQATEIEPYISRFAQITAPFGKFSILGNHDYGHYASWNTPDAQEKNLQKLKQHQADMGYRLLLNEHVTLEKDGEKLALIGVENWGKGFIQLGDLDKALSGVEADAFKVLLSHDPTHWEEIVKHHSSHVHLTLSGHTHGMQFGVETPVGSWSPAQFRYEHWAGLKEENNRMLYINRGFGFLGFSGRVGIWPEITVIELKKGKAVV